VNETIRIKNVIKLLSLSVAIWLVASVLPMTFADPIQNYANNSRQLYSDVTEMIDQLLELDEVEFTVDSWAHVQISVENVVEMLEKVEDWLDELVRIRVKNVEIRAFDMEIVDINEALISEIHNSDILPELLTTEFEMLSDFDATAEILSDEQLRFTIYYQEIVGILQDARDGLIEVYDGLEVVEVVIEIPTESANEEDETYPGEEDENDLLMLERARVDLREFLDYLNSVWDEDGFTESVWTQWQNLMEQANRVLADSDDVDEINKMMELLFEFYELYFSEEPLELPDIELLSLTRSEFDNMSLEEIAEMAEVGGYFPVGVIRLDEGLDTPSERNRNIVATNEPINACENVDNENIVTNVNVDGVVCVGNPLDETIAALMLPNIPETYIREVATAALFNTAWNDNIGVRRIVLTTNVTLTATPNVRIADIQLEGNGNSLILSAGGQATASTPRLPLGASSEGARLDINNIVLSRAITSGLAAARTNSENAPFFISVNAAASDDWEIYIHSDVRTVGTTATGANSLHRSGIFETPNTPVMVTGNNNNLIVAPDDSSAVVAMNIGSLTIQEEGSLILDIRRNGAVGINTTISTAGDVTLEEGAVLTIPTHTAGAYSIRTRAFNMANRSELNVTRTGGGHALFATGAIELGAQVEVDITMNSAGAGHAMSGTTFTAGNTTAITITRAGGAGHGITATAGNVDFGNNVQLAFTRTTNSAVTAHGINAPNNAIIFGNHANIEMHISVTGTGAANVTGNGINSPGGSVAFGANAEVNITRNTGNHTNNVPTHAIHTGSLNVGAGSVVNITTGLVAAGGFGHGITATNNFAVGDASEINIRRNGTTSAAVNGINTGAFTIGDESSVYVNMSATTGNAISGSALTTGTDVDIDVTRAGAGGGVIITGAVELGRQTDIDITMTAAGIPNAVSGTTLTANDDISIKITRNEAGGGLVFTSAIEIGERADIDITMTTAGAGHSIASANFTVGENAEININRTGGAGHSLTASAGDVIIGENSEVNITMNGTGHGIHASETSGIVDLGANTVANLGRTGGGTQGGISIAANTGGHTVNNTGTALVRADSLYIRRNTVVNVTAVGNGHGLFVRNLILEDGSEPVSPEDRIRVNNATITACIPANVTTTQLNVSSSGASGTAVRIHTLGTNITGIRNFNRDENDNIVIAPDGMYHNNGTVDIGENANICIFNTGTNNAREGGGTTGVGGTGGTETNFGLSNGLHGYIGTFHMTSNSTMNIRTIGVSFRSVVSTSYMMTGGARKTVFAVESGTAPNRGRPAMVFANSYRTGTSATAGADLNRERFSHTLNISGEGTILDITGHVADPNIHSSGRGLFILYGDNSTIDIVDGATFNARSEHTTAILLFGGGNNFNVNDEGEMNVTVNGSGTAASGAFRFLQSGDQTFVLDDGIVRVTANGGNAAVLRAFGGNNAFYVRGGGLLELIHHGTASGADGIDFAGGNASEPSTLERADRFVVEGYRSEVYLRTNRIAVSGSDASDDPANQTPIPSNLNITSVTVGEGAVFVASGAAPGDTGIFNAGRLHLSMDNPLFFDFTNRAPGNALLFNTFSSADNPSTIVGTNTDLALWRNTRVDGIGVGGVRPGGANTGATEDRVYPIADDAGGFWSNMNFDLQPNANNFAHRDLLHNGGTTSETRFEAWFDNTGLTQHTGTGTGTGTTTGTVGANINNSAVQNGWRQIRRMSANNAPPVVDILRTPTDADQRIFGHVTIPEGNRSARSAFDNEVFVDLVIKNPAGVVVQEIFNAPTGTRSVYGGAEHAGVFEALVDFEDEESYWSDNGITFLPVGYTVEVVTARRSADGLDGMPGGDGRENYRESCSLEHIASDDYPLCRSLEGILTGTERVRDITPPEQVENVTGLVNNVERFGGVVTPATTSITGTGEPGASVRVGRVTPATGNGIVTGVEWIGEPVTVNNDGTWQFIIPPATELTVGHRLSIYISDNARLSDLEINSLDPAREQLPEVIFRPGLVPDPNGEPGDMMLDPTLNSRKDVLYFNLPRTAGTNQTTSTEHHPSTPAWAGSPTPIGNINFHWNQRTQFHDALGDDGFDYAYILTIQETLESEFEFTKVREITRTGLPNAQFRLYRWNEDEWETTPMATVTSGADGIVTFVGLSHGGEYRLREHAVAPGFVPLHANHYWVISVGDDGVVSDPVPGNANTPNFIEITIEAEDEDDDDEIILILENEHRVRDTAFQFVKESDLTDLPLPGAQFSLYRRAENGIDWTLITNTLQSATTTGIVSLADLRFGGEYRLIETVSPTNYDLPPTGHHWIINVDVNNGNITTPTAHGNAPAFIQREGRFYLPNIRSIVDLFEFIKTEDDGTTPLPEAEFYLYRWCVVEDDWVEIRNDLGSAAVTGAVRVENLLTYGSQYRLRETYAPDGFALPPAEHYWRIVVDSSGNIATPTAHGNAPAFIARAGSLFLPNNLSEVDFTFFKTEENGTTRLAGAHFSLYRRNEDGDGWEEPAMATDISAETPLGFVEFNGLSPGGVYRLVETQAPNGFITPRHNYWQITVANDGSITVSSARGHGSAPDFVDCGIDDEDLCLPNILFVPITGIESNTTFFLSLALAASLAMLLARRYHGFKKSRQLVQ